MLAVLIALALGASPVDDAKAGKPLFATLDTSAGRIVVELESAAAPTSVAAFVGYATGAYAWKDAAGKNVSRPLYDGTVFHRAIPGFLVQGGDPRGTGLGGPGQTTPDEAGTDAQKALHFTRGAVGFAHVPDANANGSQFFILVGDAPWLDGRFTRLGHVVAGMDVADKIASAPRGPGDRPLAPVTLKTVRIAPHAGKAK